MFLLAGRRGVVVGSAAGCPRRRPAAAGPAEPWWIAVGALLPVGAARLLGAVSGPEPFSTHQMLAALAATGLTWALVPPGHRVLRAGVAWTAVLLLADLGWSAIRWGRTRCAWSCSSPRPVLVAVARTEWPRDPARGAGRRVAPAARAGCADLVPRDTAPVSERAAPLLRELARPRSGGPDRGGADARPRGEHRGGRGPCRWPAVGCASSTRHAAGSSTTDPSTRAGYLRWLRDTRGLLRGPAEWPAGLAVRGRGPAAAARRPWPAGGVGRPVVAAVRGAGRRRGARRTARSSPATGPGWWWTCGARGGSRSRCGGPGGRRSKARAAASAPGDRDGWTTLAADRPGRYVLTSSWRPRGRCG